MGDIFVVVEHRQGEVRDITYEMLFKAGQLCREYSHNLTAIILGGQKESFLDNIAPKADRVIVYEDESLTNFSSDIYKEILNRLIEEHRPFLTLMGHTSWGMDLGPALSAKTGYPLATDCVDILVENGRPVVIRQIFSGKVFSRVSFKESEGYLVSVRPGSFLPEEFEAREGEVIKNELPADLPVPRKNFVEFVDTAAGDVDISQADFLISIGRGVGEEDNIEALKLSLIHI